MQTRLIIYKQTFFGKSDISNQVKLTNGKANPWGWSQYTIEYRGKVIGFIESGLPDITDKNYSCQLLEEKSYVFIYVTINC